MPTHSRLLVGVSLGVAAALAWAALEPTIESRTTVHAATTCQSLTALTIPNVRVASATDVAAGPFSPVAGTTTTVPAFCRVVAVATPTTDSVINFEVWLPSSEAWNGKFLGVGNTGWSGAIPYDAMAAALGRGYAAGSTDTGHIGDDPAFAAGHPEKMIDWAYRAVHVMTIAGKLIVRAKQGSLPQHAYFTGCSTGGGQGLMSAQRYPDDYDGVVAGNPGAARIDRAASYLWSWNAAHQTPESLLSQEKLTLVNQAAVAACDTLDNVKDGVIDDPRRCNFDPGTLLCHGEESSKCLTSRQLEALRRIYNGPHSAKQVRQLFPGLPKGSEVADGQAWHRNIMAAAEPLDIGFWKHFVFADPNWDHRTFDWERDLGFAHSRISSIVTATNPDLKPFKALGGKLIVTAGWNDSVNPAEDAIFYYDTVERVFDGNDKTKDFFRLFLVPGMGQCAPATSPTSAAPPGVTTFDALTALEMWVEHLVAPEKIVASRTAASDAPARTRPLCPYPMVARWKNSGSTDDAANFTCAAAPKGK